MGNKKRRPHVGGCTCRRCEPNGRGRPQVLGDDGGSGYKKAGFGVNAAVTVASVGGNLINPPTTPNTDQLEASQSGWQENKDDVNDAAKARGRNSNTGANRRPKGK